MDRRGGVDQEQIPSRAEKMLQKSKSTRLLERPYSSVFSVETYSNPEAWREGTIAYLSGLKKNKMKHNLHYLVY